MCVLCLVCLIISCSKTTDDPAPLDLRAPGGYTVYTIKKGNHYCENNEDRSIKTNKLKLTALFDSSCIYTTIEGENMLDINKLYGFSDCNTDHHTNSARFGWRWNGRVIEIHAYCYVNGERISTLLGTVGINEAAQMSIGIAGGKYVFELEGAVYKMPRGCSGEFAEGYQLYPYFGGDEVAPHDVRILIKEG